MSIWGNRLLRTSLTRADTLDGEPESYVVELHNEEEMLLNLTPAEAKQLADHLYLLVGETRRAPATQQSGATD